MDNKKKSECKTALYWTNYNFSAWLNDGKDGKPWFKYEIQNSIFLGKNKPEGQQWKNQALSLNKIDDLCYLRTIIRNILPTIGTNFIKKNYYVAHKILDEKQKDSWIDKEKPTKQELKKALTRTRFFRTYTDKDGKEQETKEFIIFTSELDILRDFVDFCISKIFYIKSKWERSFVKYDKKQSDNIDYSKNQDEFIDEKMDDEIPF